MFKRFLNSFAMEFKYYLKTFEKTTYLVIGSPIGSPVGSPVQCIEIALRKPLNVCFYCCKMVFLSVVQPPKAYL